MKNNEVAKIDPLFMSFFLGGIFWMLLATVFSLPCIYNSVQGDIQIGERHEQR